MVRGIFSLSSTGSFRFFSPVYIVSSRKSIDTSDFGLVLFQSYFSSRMMSEEAGVGGSLDKQVIRSRALVEGSSCPILSTTTTFV